MIANILIKLLKIGLLFLLGNNVALGQIQNAGFEKEGKGAVPEGWHFNNQDSANNSIKIINTDQFDGSKSLQLIKNQQNAQLIVSTAISFETQKLAKLKIKAYAKTNADQLMSNFYLQTFDSDKKRIGGNGGNLHLDPSKKGQWQEVDFSIIIGPEVKSGILFVVLGGKGDLLIDQFETEFITEPESPKILSFADEVKNIIKKNSLVSDSINWKKLEQELPVALLGLKENKDEEEVVNYFISYLRSAKDFHSFYNNPQKFKEYTGQPVNQNDKKVKFPSGKLLENKIAYIQIPNFGSTHKQSVQSFADSLNQIVLTLQKENPKGWIVDLIFNYGGNMHPMIAGLNALIPDGNTISIINKAGKNAVVTSAGEFGYIKLSQTPEEKVSTKIAILISLKTASSGEMTLISLLGNPNAKSFGFPTAGLNSANAFHQLSNGGAISLASAYVEDINGKNYKDRIHPDFKVEAKSLEDIQNAAIKWILQ